MEKNTLKLPPKEYYISEIKTVNWSIESWFWKKNTL